VASSDDEPVVAGWETHGPDFGRIQALAVSPFDDRVVYAGALNDSSQQSALFKSADGGGSWTELSVAPPGESISGLAIDPGNASRMLARTSGHPGAVYQSEDAGATWIEVLRFAEGGSVFFDTSGSGAGYSLGAGLLWKGAGRNWTLIQPSLPSPAMVGPPTAAFPGAEGQLFAIAYVNTYPPFGNGYRLLRRDGLAWTIAGLSPCGNYGDIPATAFDPSDPEILFAIAPPCAGVLRTHDGGQAWNDIPSLQAFDVRQIVVVADDPTRLYVLTSPDGRILHSVDGGETWNPIPGPPSEPTEIALGPSGGIVHAGTGDGVFAWTVRRTQVLPAR
jgi:hypothetical protein